MDANFDILHTEADDTNLENIDNDSIQIRLGDENEEDNITIHTNYDEHPIVSSPIVNNSNNHGQKKNIIIISSVFQSPAKP